MKILILSLTVFLSGCGWPDWPPLKPETHYRCTQESSEAAGKAYSVCLHNGMRTRVGLPWSYARQCGEAAMIALCVVEATPPKDVSK